METRAEYTGKQIARIEAELDRLLPSSAGRAGKLHEAMRYSVLAGGKRIRPLLCMAACEACGGEPSAAALSAGCAIELLHTSTLIHDDLPAMDDDTLRRGRPTCHIRFDEATAILAGDALLCLAFEILAVIPEHGAALTLELARTVGSRGVIGGQAEDIEAEGKEPDAELVKYIHMNKTAALIRASCVMGGICAGASADQIRRLAAYGEKTGLAFQIIDDLLDESATEQELGKNIGSDKAKGKMTWQAVHGIEAARQQAAVLTGSALEAAKALPDGQRLLEIAGNLLGRRF